MEYGKYVTTASGRVGKEEEMMQEKC